MQVANRAEGSRHPCPPILSHSDSHSVSGGLRLIPSLSPRRARTRNLENQGFRTFMPRRRKMLRHARKLTAVEAPLFPRYLFIAFDPRRDQWRKVNSTFGVSRLVMLGEAPHPVPEGVIEALIAVTMDGGIVDLARRLQAGSPVRVMAGPFADQLARLEQLDDSGRACILLEIMGRQVRATTERHNLIPTRLTSRAVSVRPEPTLFYVVDWLPPDFGAIGQYADQYATELAQAGRRVCLIGLTSAEGRRTDFAIGRGALETVRLPAAAYDKSRFADRLLWTLRVCARLLWEVVRRHDVIQGRVAVHRSAAILSVLRCSGKVDPAGSSDLSHHRFLSGGAYRRIWWPASLPVTVAEGDVAAAPTGRRSLRGAGIRSAPATDRGRYRRRSHRCEARYLAGSGNRERAGRSRPRPNWRTARSCFIRAIAASRMKSRPLSLALRGTTATAAGVLVSG